METEFLNQLLDICDERYPAGSQANNGLVMLPDTGILYVASDFHAHYHDFEQWLDHTQIESKLDAGEDVYAVILGDVPDTKEGDSYCCQDGDLKIIERIRKIQSSPNGNRFTYITGNHDRMNALIHAYNRFCPKNLKDNIRKAADPKVQVGYFNNFNFVDRIKDNADDIMGYLYNLPVAVMTGNGLVLTHAGPSTSAKSKSDIIQKKREVVRQLIGVRPEIAIRYLVNRNFSGLVDGDMSEIIQKYKWYDDADISKFLSMMDDSSVLINGHTPVNQILPENIRDGIAYNGEQQIILATSYGSVEGQKSYLKIDLSNRINDIHDFNPNEEILLLTEANPPCQDN